MHPPPAASAEDAVPNKAADASGMDHLAGQPDAPVCDVNELSKGRRQVRNGMTHVGRMQVKALSQPWCRLVISFVECLAGVMSKIKTMAES